MKNIFKSRRLSLALIAILFLIIIFFVCLLTKSLTTKIITAIITAITTIAGISIGGMSARDTALSWKGGYKNEVEK